jgi:hypothetical protein
VLRDRGPGGRREDLLYLIQHRGVGQEGLPDGQPDRAERVRVARVGGQQRERLRQRVPAPPAAEYPLQDRLPAPTVASAASSRTLDRTAVPYAPAAAVTNGVAVVTSSAISLPGMSLPRPSAPGTQV